MGSNDIGGALRAYRIKARVNQQMIARTLGVSQSQVSRWESGRDRPRAHNEEAIRSLVWGRADPVLAGLVHHVRGAGAPLVLLDAHLRVVAASPELRAPGAPLSRFRWLFDPAENPDIGRLARRLETLLIEDDEMLGLALALPFSHEARPWLCTGRLTLYRVGADVYCVGEIAFAPWDMQDPVPGPALKPTGSGAAAMRAGSGARDGLLPPRTAQPRGSAARLRQASGEMPAANGFTRSGDP